MSDNDDKNMENGDFIEINAVVKDDEKPKKKADKKDAKPKTTKKKKTTTKPKKDSDTPKNDVSAAEPCDSDDKSCSTKKKCCSKGLCFILLLILLAVLTGVFFSKKMMINNEVLESKLELWKNLVAQSAKNSGNEVNIDYGTIKIEGNIFSRKIIMELPKFEVLTDAGGKHFITTNNLEIKPENSSLQDIKMIFNHPLKIVDGNNKRQITFKPKLVVDVSQKTGATNLKYQAAVPNNINSLKLNGDELGEVIAEIITRSGTLSGVVDVGNGDSSQVISLVDVQVKTSGQSVTFENANINAASVAADGVTKNLYDVNISRVGLGFPMNLFGKFDVKANIAQENSDFSEEYGYPAEVAYKIDEISVANDESSLLFGGDLKFMQGEMLPLGNAKLSITNVDKIFAALRAGGIMSEKDELVARNLLGNVATNWSAEDNKVNIDLQREYGGGFYIGDITFEELIAVAAGQYFSNKPQQLLQKPESELEPVEDVVKSIEETVSDPTIEPVAKTIIVKPVEKSVIAESKDKPVIEPITKPKTVEKPVEIKVETKAETVKEKTVAPSASKVIDVNKALAEEAQKPTEPEVEIDNVKTDDVKREVEKKLEETGVNLVPSDVVKGSVVGDSIIPSLGNTKSDSEPKIDGDIAPLIDDISGDASNLPWLSEEASEVKEPVVAPTENVTIDATDNIDKAVDKIADETIEKAVDKNIDLTIPKAIIGE